MDYDPFSPEMIHGDPYPIYRQLRDEAPVYELTRYEGAFALSRFQDVWDACAHPAFSVARGSTAAHLLTKVQPVTPMINTMDPPEHTRLRARLRSFFAPRRMKALEPEIRRFVVETLDALEERDQWDVVGDFGQPLATFVAATVSGFPLEDGPLLRTLVDRFFAREPGVDAMTPDGLAAMQEIGAYFGQLSASRRTKPSETPDALDELQNFETAEGRKLGDEEIASHLTLLLIGGTDTLPKVLANTVLRLQQNPDQRAAVAADPSLATDAFNEALRIDMPTQYMCRSLLEDVEFQGRKLPAGSVVLLLYGSANRDEREFSEPERYRFDRRPPRFLGFSHGTHACIGLHAARAEARIGLEELLARNPEYEALADEAVPYETEFVKGLASLPIRSSKKG